MLQNLSIGKLQSLLSALNTIPDFRKNNHLLKHKLGNILIVMILAIMSNYTSQRGMEEFSKNNLNDLKQSLGVESIPTRSLFNRVCIHLNYELFTQIVSNWLTGILPALGIKPNTVAIDGKALEGTSSKSTHNTPNQNMLYVVSVFEPNLGIVLNDQIMEGKKTSEAKVARELLSQCQNLIVTADALHCSQPTIRAMMDLDVDYVLGLKRNNALLFQQLIQQSNFTGHHQDKDERSIEIYQIPDQFKVYQEHTYHRQSKTGKSITQHSKYQAWQDLNFKTLIKVTSLKNKQIHINFYLSNLDKSAKELASIVRNHWGIENKLHREKDVIFREDHHHTIYHNTAKVFSTLIHIVMNVFRLNNYSSMQKATRKFCNKVADCLELIEFKGIGKGLV